MVKKLFYLFYIFLQFYRTSLRGKEYFAKEQEPEPGVFGPLEPEPGPLEKKIPGAGAVAAWKKIRSQSWSRSQRRFKKKSGAGAGAAKKFAGSPALVLISRILKVDV